LAEFRAAVEEVARDENRLTWTLSTAKNCRRIISTAIRQQRRADIDTTPRGLRYAWWQQ